MVTHTNKEFEMLVKSRDDLASELKRTRAELEMLYRQQELKVEEQTRDLNEAYLALERLEHYYSQLLNTNPSVIYATSLKKPHRCRFVSHAFTEITGYEPKEIYGNPDFWLNHIHPDDLARTTSEIEQSMSAGLGSATYRIQHRNGEYRYIRDNFRVINDENGQPYEIVGAWTDVTVEQQAREAIMAKETAEMASRAKSDFLAHMSHEIRTPMNAVIGMTHLALGTKLNATQQDYIREANTAARALLGILNDILDFSKIEAGKLEFEQISFDLEKEINVLKSLLSAKAHEKGLVLEINVDMDTPKWLVGDPLRLRQVLTNFVSNAIKFTPEGKVTVKVSLMEKQETRKRVRLYFEVIDSGIGLTQEQQLRLFQAFSQADSSINRHYGGTGLGLAISKKLVQMMEGEIGVKSALSKGSTFFFNAWFGIAEKSTSIIASPSVVPEDYHLQGLRVLLVDDVEVNRKVARALLAKVGAVVVAEAGHGQEALDKLENAPEAFDIILMDVQMPGIDGITATRLIRQDPRFTRLPIIAMTAMVMKGDEGKCREAGMNDFVSKPINAAELFATLLKHGTL